MRCLSRLLPIFLVALAALALTFLTLPTSAFAEDRVGQPASQSGGLRAVSGWWLLPLGAGLAGLGGLLVVLDRNHCFDELD